MVFAMAALILTPTMCKYFYESYSISAENKQNWNEVYTLLDNYTNEDGDNIFVVLYMQDNDESFFTTIYIWGD